MNKTIHILITGLDYGGAERHLLQILPALKKLGWRPVLHTFRSDTDMKSDFEAAGITIHAPEKIRGVPRILARFIEALISLKSLYKILRNDKGCIVHFFLAKAYVLGMLVATLACHKGPKIMSRRSLNNYQKNIPFFAWLEKKTHKKTDLFLANSSAVKKNMIEEGIPENNIKLIHNGIDLSRFNKKLNTDICKTLGINKNAFVITIVANLIAYKGHEDLLNALALIKNKLPKVWVLLCVGKDGGALQAVQDLTKKLDLMKHVKFLGLRSDIPQILLNSNLGVLASHQEGMPNAVMEYMAAGLPVVATNAGGTVELVENGKTGFIVPIKDPKALGEAILKVIDHKEFGQAGRQKIEKEFSITSCVSKYDRVYKEILRK